jgi:hypothetical protein
MLFNIVATNAKNNKGGFISNQSIVLLITG